MTHSVAPPTHPNTPTLLRCQNTADFLAALPHLAGFTATNCIFMVVFRGRKAHQALRLDLPTTFSLSARNDYAKNLRILYDEITAPTSSAGGDSDLHIPVAAKSTVSTSPAIVVYTEHTLTSVSGYPWAELAHSIIQEFGKHGHKLRELACVAANGWCSYLSHARPVGVRSLQEITSNNITNSLPDWHTPPGKLEHLGEVLPADSSLVQECADRLTIMQTAAPKASFSTKWITDLQKVLNPEANERDLSNDVPAVVAFIAAAQDPPGWFLIILNSVTRSDFIRDILADPDMHQSLSARPVKDLLMVLTGGSAVSATPNTCHMTELITRCSDATSLAPDTYRAPLLAMLAWCWWMRGMQSIALRFAYQAQKLSESLNTHSPCVDAVTDLVSKPPRSFHKSPNRDTLAE